MPHAETTTATQPVAQVRYAVYHCGSFALGDFTTKLDAWYSVLAFCAKNGYSEDNCTVLAYNP